jgi:hypothetical protein
MSYRVPGEPAPPKAPIVVTRPEPPTSDATPKLTREEIRALIAVEGAKHPPWKSSVRRSPLLLIVGLVSQAFGSYSLVVGTVLTIAALVWIARPLFRRDEFSGP